MDDKYLKISIDNMYAGFIQISIENGGGKAEIYALQQSIGNASHFLRPRVGISLNVPPMGMYADNLMHVDKLVSVARAIADQVEFIWLEYRDNKIDDFKKGIVAAFPDMCSEFIPE